MKLTSRKRTAGNKIELAMTSMIDVVFLLLIFFMVSASFVKTERELNPGIQVKSDSSPRRQIQRDRAEIRLERGASGQFVYKLGGAEFEQAETDRLSERLKVSFSQQQKTEEGAIIYVHDDAPFAMAAGAIQACKTAGFIGVSYVPSSSN